MNIQTRMSIVFVTLLCAASGAVFAGEFSTQSSQESRAGKARRIVTVQVALDDAGRTADLALLSHFDFMGLDASDGQAQFFVSESEIAAIRKSGFWVSFENKSGQQYAEPPIGYDLYKYLSPAMLKTKLEALQSASRGIMTMREFGTSHRNRPLVVVELTSKAGNRVDKPTILFNGMHHAREVMTTEVTVHLIEKFLSRTTSFDNEMQKWLDSYRILIVPQVNPDGNDLVHNGQAMWRKNAWTDQGKLVGVDLNRNYPSNWNACNGSSGNQSEISYRGPAAASEPEVQAMLGLVAAERPVANISYHSFSEMVLYPFGCADQHNTAIDLYKSIAADIRKETIDDFGRPNTYRTGTPSELLYSADGGDIDTHWTSYGVMSFAMEVNSALLGFAPNYGAWRDDTVKRLEGSWKALLRRMDKNAIRANVVSPGGFFANTVDNITYRIERVTGVGQAEAWVDANVEPFHLRNDSGLFYQIVLPGTYEIIFMKNGVEAKKVQVKVSEGVTNLGSIEL